MRRFPVQLVALLFCLPSLSFGQGSVRESEAAGSVSRQTSTVQIDVVDEVVTLGEAITVFGAISPPPADSVEVRFTSVNPIGTVTVNNPESTASFGMLFSQTWYPNAATEGRSPWLVQASWDGDELLEAAQSSPIEFEVQKAQPTVRIALMTPAETFGGTQVSVPIGFTQVSARAELDVANFPDELRSLLAGRPLTLSLFDPDSPPQSRQSISRNTQLDEQTGKYFAHYSAEDVRAMVNSDLDSGDFGFDEIGLWTFHISFAGNGNLKSAASNIATVEVQTSAGFAILVVGALDDDSGIATGLGEGQVEHTKTMDFVYRSLKARGFADADVFYMREDVGEFLPTDNNTPSITDDLFVDEPHPHKSVLQGLLDGTLPFDPSTGETLRSKMNSAPDSNLTIVLIDHGVQADPGTDGPGRFAIFHDQLDDSRYLTSFELDEWLGVLESQLTPTARQRDRAIVIGACYSGEFVADVSAPGRIVITSAGIDEYSHRGSVDPLDGIRDGEVFVTELFRRLRNGVNLKAAFEVAATNLSNFTIQNSDAGDVLALTFPQRPLLDDNGDSSGSTSTSSGLIGGDGHRAALFKLGVSAIPSIGARWVQAPLFIALDEGESIGSLIQAQATDADKLNFAWIEVKAPQFEGSEPAAGGSSGGVLLDELQHELRLFQFTSDQNSSPSPEPPSNGIYTWSEHLVDSSGEVTLGNLLSDPGSYQVFYFLRDTATNETTDFLTTLLHVDLPQNDPPSRVSPLIPADNTFVSSGLAFTWQPSLDPDGDNVTYVLELDRRDAADQTQFESPDIVKYGIVQTGTGTDRLLDVSTHQIVKLEDLKTYYWRVVPIDEFGRSPNTSPDTYPFHSFTVNNGTNPGFGGFVQGSVIRDVSESLLPGRTIPEFSVRVLTQENQLVAQFPQAQPGFYVSPELDPAVYTIEISATGYQTAAQIVTIQSVNTTQSIAQADFQLQESETGTDIFVKAVSTRDQFRELDLNGDKRLTPAEAGVVAGDFSAWDLNANGFLTIEELLAVTVGPPSVAEIVYVDFDPHGAEFGTSGLPFDSLDEAVAFVAPGGQIRLVDVETKNCANLPYDCSRVDPNDYVGNYALSKSATIHALSGTVGIGIGSVGRYFPAAPFSVTQREPVMRPKSGLPKSAVFWRHLANSLSRIRPNNSDFASPASGFDLSVRSDQIYEPALPLPDTASGLRFVRDEQPIFIQLVSPSGIKTSSLWAEMPAFVRGNVDAEWFSHSRRTDPFSVWICLIPSAPWSEIAGSRASGVAFSAGGIDSRGLLLASGPFSYEVAPSSHNPAVTGNDSHETNAKIIRLPVHEFELAPGVVGVYRIAPELAFDSPQTLEIALPTGPGPVEYELRYLLTDRGVSLWIPASRVYGFLGSVEMDTLNGASTLRIEALHAGTVALMPKNEN